MNSVIVVMMLVHWILSGTWMLLCICSFTNNFHDAISHKYVMYSIGNIINNIVITFLFFSLFLIIWRIIVLQYCVSLCCTTTWTNESHALSIVCSPPDSLRQQSPTRTYLKFSSLYTISHSLLWLWVSDGDWFASYEQVTYSFSFGWSSLIYTLVKSSFHKKKSDSKIINNFDSSCH